MGRKSNAQKMAEAEAARLAALEADEETEENENEENEEENTPAPKRRGRRPKDDTGYATDGSKLPSLNNLGVWSDERYQNVSELPVIKDRMKIEIQLQKPALGMSPADPEALKYVAKKEDEQSPDDGTTEERTTTIWPKAHFIRDQYDGHWILVDEPNCPTYDPETTEVFTLPYIFDYQLRGMFKDSCGLLNRSKNNISADLKSYKKRIDGNIFIAERKIPFNMPDFYEEGGKKIPTYTEAGGLQSIPRTLRISGPTGERSAISISEVIPPNSTFKFEVLLTDAKLRSVVVEWLDYGLLHGLGQWRNSGIGTYRWRELDENWEPKV